MKQSFYSEQDNVELFALKQEVKRAKEELLKSTFDLVYAESSTSLKRALDTARHKGASNWLSTLPIEYLGYSLNKQEFRAACRSGTTDQLKMFLSTVGVGHLLALIIALAVSSEVTP